MKLYPLVFEYVFEDEDEDPVPLRVVTKFTDREWKRLIDRTFEVLEMDSVWSGVEPVEVIQSSDGLFLEIRYHFNKKTYDKFPLQESKVNDHQGLITDILNISIQNGYPSFYDNNEKDGKKVDAFVLHDHGTLK